MISCAVVVYRRAYELGAEPAAAIPLRLAVPAVVFWVWAAVDVAHGRTAVFADRRAVLWSAALGLTILGGSAGELGSLARLEAPLVVIFFSLGPLWVAILSRIAFKTSIPMRSVGAIALVVLGTLVIVGAPAETPDVTGILFAIGGSFSASISLLVLERPLRRASTHHVWAIGLTVGALLAFAIDPEALVDTIARGEESLPYLLLGSVLAGTSLFLISWGIQRSSAFIGSVTATTEVVWTALLAWIVLGETLAPVAIGGAVLVLLGVLAGNPALRRVRFWRRAKA